MFGCVRQRKIIAALRGLRCIYAEGKKLKRALAHDTRVFQKYRNLLMELTRKNIKLKYRDSWIGILWSFLQPLLNMIVLSVVFSGIFGRSNKGVICYPVFLFTGR